MRTITLALFVAMSASVITTNAQTVSIMPLGNSTTEEAEGKVSYRCWLWEELADSGYAVDFVGTRSGVWGGIPNGQAATACPVSGFDADHEGHFGWEANEVAYGGSQGTSIFIYPGRLGQWLLSNVPDIVLLHIGTNDLDRDHGVTSTRDEVDDIIDTLRVYNPAVTVLVAQIIPSKDQMAEIGQFNALVPPLAAAKNQPGVSEVIAVDLNTGFNTDWLRDNFHPEEAGDRFMARRWADALLPVLSATHTHSTKSVEQTVLHTCTAGLAVDLLGRPLAGAGSTAGVRVVRAPDGSAKLGVGNLSHAK